MECKTYSQRLLQPFHGLLQTLEIDGGIAESSDGHSWKLYVADPRIASHTGLSEVRYGSWNPRQGALRSPTRCSTPAGLIEEIGRRLIRALEDTAGRVPFPASDRHEFWLLDRQGRPLALLASAIDPATRETPAPVWRPGRAAQQEFSSPHGDAEDLASLLGKAAGSRPRGVWIERDTRGGITDRGERYAPTELPDLAIRTRWSDPRHAALVADFLAWQAPWLLQLAELDRSTRAALERSAWQRPEPTCRLFRLYPQVIDRQGLTATRVRGRIAGGQESTNQAETLYPFVNE